MKTIKMDYLEFEELHKTINAQEKIIKILEKEGDNVIILERNSRTIPRHCLGDDACAYDRNEVYIPEIRVGDDALEEITTLQKQLKVLSEKYGELYSIGTRRTREELKKEVRKELKEEMRATAINPKKAWWKW